MSDVQATAGGAHGPLLALLVHGIDYGCGYVLCAARNGRRSRGRLEGELAEEVLDTICGHGQQGCFPDGGMRLMGGAQGAGETEDGS